MPLIATRGAASVQGFGEFAQSGPVNYIEDVFSTYLYTGNSSTQTITNNIDLSTKGGLVWAKCRTLAANHRLTDTVRGAGNSLISNSTLGNQTAIGNGAVTSFASSGYITDLSGFNSTDTQVSWTFREQPKFFDVVTFTTNSSGAATVSHNLGATPGCVIVKRTDSSEAWWVYHRSLNGGTNPDNHYLFLNTTAASSNFGSAWITVSSTEITFPTGSRSNSATYVAYLFAHDAGGFGLTGSDNVITCGSYTTDGSGNATVSLGYEPQWLLTKLSSTTGDWRIIDNMRQMSLTNNFFLYPNTSGAEVDNTFATWRPTATGFTHNQANANQTFIYIAIRRGPMKTPTTGTSVFYPQAISQADSIDSTNVPFPPDLINTFSRDGTNRTNKFSYFQFVDRLRGAGTPNDTRVAASEGLGLVSSGTDAEYGQANPPGFTYVQLKANSQDITRGTGWNSASYGNWINYFFRRAPGFFDVVCGNATSFTFSASHNLTVVPEMIITKDRAGVSNWAVYHSALGVTKYLYLNSTNAVGNASPNWSATSTTFSDISIAAGPTDAMVAYLFASVAGVSKVGSYTGTGALQTVNCGFTTGARFVLIKRTDSTGDWWVYDSARGISSGNDPYLFLNSTAAEVTNTNYVDTTSVGFQVTAAAPAGLNANGGTYIFLAIA